jgi:hypothetical protein
MGDSEDRGDFTNYFQLTAGDSMGTDLLDGVVLSWNRISGGEKVGTILENAYQSFRPEKPSATVPALMEAYRLMKALPIGVEVKAKQKDLLRVIKECMGMWLEAIATESSASPGNDIKIAVSALNRSDLAVQLDSVRVESSNVIEGPQTLKNNVPLIKNLVFKIPLNMPYTQPYWLEKSHDGSVYQVKNQQFIGLPESPAPFHATFQLSVNGQSVEFVEPVMYRWIDPVEGERYRIFEVVPEVSIHVKEPVTVYTTGDPKSVFVSVSSVTNAPTGVLSLKLPAGWNSDPQSIPFQLDNKGQSLGMEFRIQPLAGASRGTFYAEANVGGKILSSDVVSIDYRHISPQTVLKPAEGILLPIDLKKRGENIAYIMGSGDGIPVSLEQVGYHVSLLTDQDLASGDLARFDSIIVGIRAYNTRTALKASQQRLMEYVKNGGTLVAQYNTQQDLIMENLGPYPFRISRERVSVEDATITVLSPENPLLNIPNKITQKDFEEWIQERGLYFPDQWDSQYQTLIACNDPGESAKTGGILYAKYGKGIYIYTAYSWFRELPAGVPGAYRLFINLVSAQESHGK